MSQKDVTNIFLSNTLFQPLGVPVVLFVEDDILKALMVMLVSFHVVKDKRTQVVDQKLVYIRDRRCLQNG